MPGVYNTGHKVCSLALTGLNMPEDLINFLLAAPGAGTPPRALPRAVGARAGHWPRATARAFKGVRYGPGARLCRHLSNLCSVKIILGADKNFLIIRRGTGKQVSASGPSNLLKGNQPSALGQGIKRRDNTWPGFTGYPWPHKQEATRGLCQSSKYE